MNDKLMPLRPRVSEKAYKQSQLGNVYVFVTPKDANKQTIAGAVATQFNVTVTSVNIINIKGKATRSVRKGGRVSRGKQSDFKKAYVTIKNGDHIPIFVAEEEADKKAEKATAKATVKREKA